MVAVSAWGIPRIAIGQAERVMPALPRHYGPGVPSGECDSISRAPRSWGQTPITSIALFLRCLAHSSRAGLPVGAPLFSSAAAGRGALLCHLADGTCGKAKAQKAMQSRGADTVPLRATA